MSTTAHMPKKKSTSPKLTEAYRQEVLADYRLCCVSREVSILARKEVLSGRANFGIIGDGKEVAQVAMARAWRKGDFRSGYYRDQTLAFALGMMNLDEFFAQLYGDPIKDTASGGRQMNCHFTTPMVDADGQYLDLKNRYNTTADIAPTAGQMARGLGLAFASKKFRELPHLCGDLSNEGREICWVTIGDASTSEGVFWETINAAGVLQVPLAVSVWDDGYGISVPKKYQTTKESISEILAGFDGEGGVDIKTAKAWDYPSLRQLYSDTADAMRLTHRPVLFHIQEVTQQLGHSTSGDHRRYKSPERLAFEEAFDCNKRMAEWMIETGLATTEELEVIRQEARVEVIESARRAYRSYHDQVQAERNELVGLIQRLAAEQPQAGAALGRMATELEQLREPFLRYELVRAGRRAAQLVVKDAGQAVDAIRHFNVQYKENGHNWYSKYLMSEGPRSALKVPATPAQYSPDAPQRDGFEILNACFDAHFATNPAVFAFGEDVGMIGDVNQGFRGLQQRYGMERIFDTGIREWTIMGQAIGLALRGLRPIAEIQYLDYLLYGLPALSDDLCTTRWRTNNQQAAPAIIRTRGHRLVGVWHAGSPIGMMLGALRGMYICVPRDMTQAAGMYNTLLRADDPAIVIECLNGYRLKETLPDNVSTFTVALGTPEVLRTGTDVTLVTYGSCVRVALEAADLLAQVGINVEIIDPQTLLPFDLPHSCVASLRKTNRLVVLDEDFQGGATGYILQHILEEQGGYQYLDAAPVTLYAKDHRTAYSLDGDYFTKPQVEDVFDAIYAMMRESDPVRF
jgi:pyruvate/2-oxoglutarate/acetoin dehydrogenase E1 component/TPP-dependent pyruvate/acetoin dehydrogenase alpha subunit